MKTLIKALKILGSLCAISILTAAFLLLSGVWWGHYSRQKLEAKQVKEFMELKSQLFLDQGILQRDSKNHNNCWLIGKLRNSSPKVLKWVEVRVEIFQDHGRTNDIDHIEPVDVRYFDFATEARPGDWKFFEENFEAKFLPEKYRFHAKISNARFEDSALVSGRSVSDLTGIRLLEEEGQATNSTAP